MPDRYRFPRVIRVGDVRDVTQGSGNQTSDPSGHAGYQSHNIHYDTVGTAIPLPSRE